MTEKKHRGGKPRKQKRNNKAHNAQGVRISREGDWLVGKKKA